MGADQLFYAMPGDIGTCVVIKSFVHRKSLRADVSTLDSRCTVTCKEGEDQSWLILPGQAPGTLRLKNITHGAHGQFLYCESWTGIGTSPDGYQDWIVIPKIPFYVGDFELDVASGSGQVFWPNGAPAFKGQMRDDAIQRGFLFDERGICHGHFQFTNGIELDGFQPGEWDGSDVCIKCMTFPTMISIGRALNPCGHGATCEKCMDVLKECPLCRQPVCGFMQVS